jgi:methylthioribose-1-phosphate isomerase
MGPDEEARNRAMTDPPAEQPRDPSRRQFFRAFGRQTVQGAGGVLRAADELRRGSASAASELLGLGLRDPNSSAARLEQRVVETASPADARALASQRVTGEAESGGFRSPYLFNGSSLVMLDQREAPASGRTVECSQPSEVATAIAAGVVSGGPVLAQVAAYGLVLAAASTDDRLRPARRAAFQAAANTLRAARPATRAVGWAVERMARRWELSLDLDAQAVVAELRAEADDIATESATDHARLGRHGAAALDQPEGRPLSLLVHGDMGPLAGGLVGTGFAVLQSVKSAGRDVHVWLTEATPGGEGRRIAAAQLEQADISHTVIPDTALGWLFAEQTPDAVLLRADTVCANGDLAALLGSLSVARLAAAGEVPVYACTPTLVVDSSLPDGDAIPRSRRSPELDVVPAGCIAGYITEEGLHRPPYSTSLAEAVASRLARPAEAAA